MTTFSAWIGFVVWVLLQWNSDTSLIFRRLVNHLERGGLPLLEMRAEEDKLVPWSRYQVLHVQWVWAWLCYLCYVSEVHTSRKVEGSVPDELIGISIPPNLFNSTMALVSTRSLTGLSTRSLPGDIWRVRLTTSLPSVSQISRKCECLDVS
jgi:hypothetical protein